MNKVNYLPNDIMQYIMDIRRQEMKNDLYKSNYNNFVNDFKESIYNFKDDILRDRIGHKKLYGNDCKDHKKILDTYELWEISSRILTPTGEEWEDEERENILNWYIED